MQKVMVRYCDQRMADSDKKLEALRTKDDEEGGANTNMQRVVGKTKKANPKAAGARVRHVKRSLFALPHMDRLICHMMAYSGIPCALYGPARIT